MALVAPDPLPGVPNPDAFMNPAQRTWLAGLVAALRSSFANVVTENTAASRLMLADSTGKIYTVTVNTDGTLNVAPFTR